MAAPDVVLRVGNSNEMLETFCFDKRIMQAAIHQKSHDFRVKFSLKFSVTIVFNWCHLMVVLLHFDCQGCPLGHHPGPVVGTDCSRSDCLKQNVRKFVHVSFKKRYAN